jgi:hypothetical protein
MHPTPPPPRARAFRRLAIATSLTAALAGACASKGGDAPAARRGPATIEAREPEAYRRDQIATTDAPSAPAGAFGGIAGRQVADRPPGVGGSLDGAPVDNRKIVRTGHIELIVATYDDTRDRIEAIVAEAGGFVDSTRAQRSEGQVSSATIVVRVPSKTFGDLLPRLRALGDIQQESTDAADITEAYVDSAGRLAGARALEKRLLELAATGTGSVSEVLEVERELSRIRGEIEQLEGQLRMWNDQVSLSTLTISLSTVRPEIAAAAAPTFNRRVSMAWHDSIGALGTAAEGFSLALIALLPWLPLLAPLAFFGIRFLRRRIRLPRAIAYVPVAYPPPQPYPPPPPAASPVP